MKHRIKLWGISFGLLLGISVSVLLLMALWAPKAHAYATWSDGCIGCHGDFNSGTYVSASDGTSWGTNLMAGHSAFMGSGTCNVCHQPPSGTPRTPVYISLSAGITGYSPISCLGCHGRLEDAQGAGACVEGDPTTINTANCGAGAGLRLHHQNAGISDCTGCHSDPTPVGENVLPPYYFVDAARPNKPLDPCNAATAPANENKYGTTGLDNDGDGLYDGADPDCVAGVPDINLSPTSLNFGTVTVGTPSMLSFQIQNLGTAALNVTSIIPTAGTSAEFAITSAPALPFTIPAGGSQAVQVTYTPTGVGLDSGGLDIASDDPDEATVTLGLSGTGVAAPEPDINLNPPSLAFGTVTVGTPSTLSVQIENLGTANLSVNSIIPTALTSAEFSVTSAPALPFTIPASGSQTVQVTYTPTGVGLDTGGLQIVSNDPDEAVITLGLSGTGVAAPEPDINLNPPTLDFGTVTVGGSNMLSAQIQNLGAAPLNVTGIALAAGTSAEFAITSAPATPFTIPAGGSQAVQVTYTPTGVGLDSGGVEIASDDPDEPTVTLGLSGTGVAAPEPDINLNPNPSLDFGTVFLGSASALNADIQNLGGADLTVNSINLCAGTSMEFSGMSDPTPFVIPPGASRMVSVTYAPVDVGPDTG